MVNFSSIAPHLQVSIAEKMDYCDQMEFQMSSKHAINTFKLTRFTGTIDVSNIYFTNDVVTFMLKCRDSLKFWSVIHEAPHLPRFKVSRITIRGGVSLDSIIELVEKAKLVEKVFVETFQTLSLPFYSKLAEMFEIEKLHCFNDDVNLELFSLPSFLQLDYLNVCVSGIPEEILLLVKAKSILLREYRRARISTTANLFLKQWLLKKREIEWFRLGQSYEEDVNNIITIEFPVSILWRYEDHNPEKTFKVKKDEILPHQLLKDDVVYSVDRGDQKLLIIVGRRQITAMEYNELDKDIRIAEDNDDS